MDAKAGAQCAAFAESGMEADLHASCSSPELTVGSECVTLVHTDHAAGARSFAVHSGLADHCLHGQDPKTAAELHETAVRLASGAGHLAGMTAAMVANAQMQACHAAGHSKLSLLSDYASGSVMGPC